MNEKFDITVVGAGPIGAALALSLSQLNEKLSVLLLDSASQAPKYNQDKIDARIFAINAGSQKLLEKLGVWGEITSKRCQPYSSMHVWDAQGTGSITFDTNELEVADGNAPLGHIVESSLIQDALLSAIAQQQNIELRYGCSVTEIDEQSMVVQLNTGASIDTQLLCAADGANSSVRSMLGLPQLEQDVGQSALVANIFHEKPNEACAWQIFHPTGPLAFLPLADFDGKHLSSIVWSLDDDKAESIRVLSDEDFLVALERALEGKFGELKLASERYGFPLKQRHSKSYSVDGIVLVGDAAHSIHPLAGLGANLGFGDVVALTKELARAIEREIPLGHSAILNRYQRSRKLDNELVLQSMRGFKELFGADNLTVNAIRNFGVAGVDRFPAVKRKILQQAMMLN